MDFNIQAKILRILEEKKVKRIGENIERPFDARIVSATNQNIDELIEKNKFRRDLFYRLNTIEIPIPPLKERPEDIQPLLEFFISNFSIKLGKTVNSYEPELVSALTAYSFPGNVREFRNMVERAIIVSDGNKLKVDDFILPAKSSSDTCTMQNTCETENVRTESHSLNLDSLIIETIRTALIKADYNKSRASEYLGISRYSLDRKLKKYEELQDLLF